MTRSLVSAFALLGFVLLGSCPAAAVPISWGPATLSDDNVGDFLTDSTTTISGVDNTVFVLTLPNYSVGEFSQVGQLDLALTATSPIADIIGVTFTYFGIFVSPGSASFVQTAGLGSVSGTFSSDSVTGTIDFAPTAIVDLTTQLNLLTDLGGEAAVSSVQLNILTAVQAAVPQPATIGLVSLGLALLGLVVRARRGREAR